MDGFINNGFSGLLSLLVLIVLPLIFAITLHEAAHGWVAKLLGDKTAYLLGRVSLNPVRHISLFGTIVLPLLMVTLSMMSVGAPFFFGWAKPVPINWFNLRNLRRDKALVALAGPASNLMMAFFWGFIAMLSLDGLQSSSSVVNNIARYFYMAGEFGVMINIVLAFLNLIPIPPLDGSRVISAIIPNRWGYYYDRMEPYGIWILLGLIFLGGLRYLLYPPVNWAIREILGVFGLL
jgi:Zn-dependent protease